MERPAYSGQILDEDHASGTCMLPIESISDILVLIYRVEDPIGIVLHRSREDDYFIHFGHLSEELLATRSDAETPLAVHFVIVHERLIKV